MRYILAALLSVCAFFAQAQQINPVPDYVFGNRMSVGRTSVTDTAAYFSVGPRYGAIRGMMPPMVVDTASVSGNKRNGLLIFSVQKNKFLYWDSVRVQWSDMAGSSGSYIVAGDTASMLLPYLRKADTTTMLAPYLKESDTVFLSNRVNLKVNISDTATMLAPYLKESDTAFLSNRINLKVNISDTSSMLTNYVRHAGYGLTKSGQAFLVDTAAMATRARVQKGIDSVASIGLTGSGTTNYVAKFTGTKALGNSVIYDDGTNVGVGTTSPTVKIDVLGVGRYGSTAYTNLILDGTNTSDWGNNMGFRSQGVNFGFIGSLGSLLGNTTKDLTFYATSGNGLRFFTNGSTNERAQITSGGNFLVGTTTDAGYKADIAGTLRSTLGANFATTSGSVGIGTASPNFKLDITAGGISSSHEGINIRDAAADRIRVGYINTSAPVAGLVAAQVLAGNVESNGGLMLATRGNVQAGMSFFTSPDAGVTGLVERMRISGAGEVLVNTTSDAGAYALQVAGSIYNTTGAVLAASSGSVGIGTASPTGKVEIRVANSGTFQTGLNISNAVNASFEFKLKTDISDIYAGGTGNITFSNGASIERMRITTDGELLINTTTDAGDYKLQVNGNERIAGKLDVITTTEYGVNLGRSGTSATGFQAYNSTAAMAVGIESSAGGGLFTGTSAYAAVFGNANNYPTQFVTNNTLRATISAAGELLVGTTSDQGDYNIQTNNAIYAAGNAAGVGVLVGSDKSIETTGVNLNINANQGGAGTSTISMKLTSATPAFTFSSDAVMLFGTNTYSTMTNGLTMKNGTAPTGSATDQFHMYSADITAGNAAAHFRTENNAVIKLYQETTGVAAAAFTANSGTAVNDASTFDGYTLKQVVKALRNLGILQ